MTEYAVILHEVHDEAVEGRSHTFRVTLAHHGVVVEFADQTGAEVASVVVENYGGPIRAHTWNVRQTERGDDPTTIILCDDPDSYKTPEED